MASAWKSASTAEAGRARRAARDCVLALIAMAAAAAPAHAGARLDRVTGHLAVGYVKPFIAGSPGGSISTGAGLEYALGERFGLGAELGYDLLGSRDVKRDTLYGTVDYSAFQVSLRLNWNPTRLGPIHRVSAGPIVFSAKGEVQTPFGGLPFGDLSVHEVAPGAALDLTLLSAAPHPVRLGLEIGTRLVFLSSQTWSLATVRLAFHY